MAEAEATPKETAPKETAPRKAAARKTAPRKTAEKRPAPKPRPPAARGGWDVAVEAARQLRTLTGSEVEGITGLHRTDDGWLVLVDVLELRRIPETTDVIATYEVELDADGGLSGYRRQHRFVRGEVGD